MPPVASVRPVFVQVTPRFGEVETRRRGTGSAFELLPRGTVLPVGIRDAAARILNLSTAVEIAADRAPFATESFAIEPTTVVATVVGADPVAPHVSATSPRISRALAMQVPAVKRVRDLTCNAAGVAPLRLRNAAGVVIPWALFEQPERGRARSVTMTRTYEDLLFEAEAWWYTTEFGWHGYPTFVTHMKPGRVRVVDGDVYVDGKPATADDLNRLIRFESPNDALLVAGARAIRTCLMLEHAAALLADGIPATEYFTPSEGMDPATTDDEIVAMLNDYIEQRRQRKVGYIPAALDYHTGQGFTPEQLQLADSRNHAVLEIARLASVDPEEVGVSTTSRTYANMFERRKQFTDFTTGPYQVAVEGRLAMPDVTPRGTLPFTDLESFLGADPNRPASDPQRSAAPARALPAGQENPA